MIAGFGSCFLGFVASEIRPSYIGVNAPVAMMLYIDPSLRRDPSHQHARPETVYNFYESRFLLSPRLRLVSFSLMGYLVPQRSAGV